MIELIVSIFSWFLWIFDLNWIVEFECVPNPNNKFQSYKSKMWFYLLIVRECRECRECKEYFFSSRNIFFNAFYFPSWSTENWTVHNRVIRTNFTPFILHCRHHKRIASHWIAMAKRVHTRSPRKIHRCRINQRSNMCCWQCVRCEQTSNIKFSILLSNCSQVPNS